MKHILLLLFVFPFFTFSQCPPDGTFASQAEIDAFATEYPDCNVLESSLVISGDDITNLNGLEQIGQVSRLIIQNNPLLLNLDGLNQNLIINSFFGELTIENNPVLTNINALEFVTDGEDIVEVEVDISDNPMLNDLYGFPLNLDAITYLYIDNNDSLTNLEGLQNSGAQLLYITNNGNLNDLSGMQIPEATHLTISDNASLEGFNIQDEIFVQYLIITGNPNLTDINLPENSGIDASLTIENNTSLSVCDVNYVCQFLSPGYLRYTNISNNLSGCDAIVEVEYSCGMSPGSDECEFDVEGYLEDYFTVDIGETITINNEFATTSSPVPSCNEVADRRDLWFVFNSGDLTSVDITTEAGYSVQLWEGSCYDLTQVENACGGPELNDVPVVPDTYYIIQIWSNGSGRMSSTTGWFDLTVQDGLLSNTEYAFNELSIYPNPVNASLNIEADKPIDAITIHNLLGQEVMHSFPNSLNTQLNLESLYSGIYLVQVSIEGQQKTYKIIRE